MVKDNSTDCRYLDKLGVTTTTPCRKLYLVEGDWIMSSSICIEHCPFPECVLDHPEWRVHVDLQPQWLKDWEEENE